MASQLGGEEEMTREALSGVVRLMHHRLASEIKQPSFASGNALLPSNDECRVSSSTELELESWKKLWASVPASDARLYASAMDKLFHDCWEATDYVATLLSRYFRAAPADHKTTRQGTGFSVVPPAAEKRSRDEDSSANDALVCCCGRGAQELKRLRRIHFATHGVCMTPEEVAATTAVVNATYEIRHRDVVVLDVGSCHGGLLRRAPSWMKVVGIDLCPANSSVFQGDWLQVPLLTGKQNGGQHELGKACEWRSDCVAISCMDSESSVTQSAVVHGIVAGVADAIVMCYMLSFLPSGALRGEACRKAHKALPVGGVLLILEPRRGAHRKQWYKLWTTRLEGCCGFEHRKTELLLHTVVLLFEKTTPDTGETDTPILLEFD